MKKFIELIIISFIFILGCKKEEPIVAEQPKQTKVEEIDREKGGSIYFRHQSKKDEYYKYTSISFAKFKDNLIHPNDISGILSLEAFDGGSQRKDGKINQSETFLSLDFKDIKQPELHYEEGMFRAIGYLRKIECIEFTDQFKDCKLYLKNNEVYDAEFKPEGEILLKVKNNSLYLIIPLTYGTSDFLAYRNENGPSSPESFESFKKAYNEYRKDKFAPPLEKFDYKEEDMKVYEE
ncbi:hypothetical protein [Leptospira sp. 'Mane']|uniref:hypothetical protein n=1 Tax=Leptospira sp. 'Mane' TaxID=3387407 RepID=UPI00398AF931